MRFMGGGRGRTGSSSHRYPGNASTVIESIPEHPSSEDRPSTAARNLTTASSMRTWHWPFQSSISNSRRPSGAQHSRGESSAQHSRSTSFGRRLSAGWNNFRPASSVLGSDIVPDYVVNYMRGETPESLARKREMAGNPHTPEFERGDGTASQQADYVSLRTNSRLMMGDLEEMGSRGSSGRSLLRRVIGGWTGGVMLSAALAGVILLGLVVLVALAATRNMISLSDETVFEGDCKRVRSVDQGIHAAIMVCAFVLVAGANYTSQVLVSPTRDEVDAAHSKADWLDIGIPSMRNMPRIGKGRSALAALMVLVSVASSIVFNATAFTTENDSTCSLTLNAPLLPAAAVLTLLFTLFSISALFLVRNTSPLITLGDAISSFLTDPDPTTDGTCLLTKREVRSGAWGRGEARYWFTASHRWVQTPSGRRWIAWIFSLVAPLAMAAAMLSMALVDKTENAWTWGKGPSSTHVLPESVPMVGLGLVVSLPQVLLAVLYFSTNALLSVMYLSHEMEQFALPDMLMPLRVSSSPVGFQTSSLYLTLPRPLSWLLFILFAAKAFFLSQSFALTNTGSQPVVGLHPLPLTVLLGLLVLTTLVVLSLSLRRSDMPPDAEGRRAGNPLVLKGGSCSAVLSARSHRAADEGEDVVGKGLSWGVVDFGASEGKGVGHGAFSGRAVDYLRVGKAYA